MSSRIFWGDLHNHCDISYGHGSLDRALKLARQQLDFVSITGHAFWPDIPTDRKRYGSVIDYHEEGFRKLHAGWDGVLTQVEKAEVPGNFIAFPGFEWHSRANGDHNIIYKDTSGPLIGGNSLVDLRRGLEESGKDFILEPHHIGYPLGGRGVNWEAFQPDHSPVVEIYSLHGCSESDDAPYPMLGTMGPRDFTSTARSGLEKGHRFGFIASTDQHSGHPGSYGDGRLAVFAEELTRDSIWNALYKRNTYAVTGDKIEADFRVNNVLMGGEANGSKRSVLIKAEGSDYWKTIELIKNGRVYRRWSPMPSCHKIESNSVVRAKIRVEWGWFRPSPPIEWECSIRLNDGAIVNVETCFRGDPVVRRDEISVVKDTIPNEIVETTEKGISWKSVTEGNLSTRHSKTQAIILTVEMPSGSSLEFCANEFQCSYSIDELTTGTKSHYVMDFPSPAICIHRAVCDGDYSFECDLVDDEPERDTDYYYARMEQMNGQCAWLSPVWVS